MRMAVIALRLAPVALHSASMSFIKSLLIVTPKKSVNFSLFRRGIGNFGGSGAGAGGGSGALLTAGAWVSCSFNGVSSVCAGGWFLAAAAARRCCMLILILFFGALNVSKNLIFRVVLNYFFRQRVLSYMQKVRLAAHCCILFSVVCNNLPCLLLAFRRVLCKILCLHKFFFL